MGQIFIVLDEYHVPSRVKIAIEEAMEENKKKKKIIMKKERKKEKSKIELGRNTEDGFLVEFKI